MNIKTKLDVKASTVSTDANYLELWTQQKQFFTNKDTGKTNKIYKFLINRYYQIANKLQSTARTAQTVYFTHCYTIIFWFHISDSFFVSLTSTPNFSHHNSLSKPPFSLFFHSLYSSSNCATGFRRRQRGNKPLYNFTLPMVKWGTQQRLNAPTPLFVFWTSTNAAVALTCRGLTSTKRRPHLTNRLVLNNDRAINGSNDNEGIPDVREKLIHDL